jgi:5S rRNA maturation endonuclease (ribonuclease M5)
MTQTFFGSLEELAQFLKSIGLSKVSLGGEYVKFSSPYREDRDPSMVCYFDNLYCIDFGSDTKVPLSKLVNDLTHQNIYSILGIDRKDTMSSYFTRDLSPRKLRKKFYKNEIEVNITEGQIRKDFTEAPLAEEYCERRMITREFREKFDVGYTLSCKVNGTLFRNRVCVPIIENGKLISIEGRDFVGGQRAKVLYPRGGSVSTLFNIDNLEKKKPLIIVEGLMDLAKIWKFISKNVTTTFGVKVTKRQQDLLNQFEDIILFPDDDAGGEEFIKIFDKFYEHNFRIVKIFGKDPGDATVEEIKEVMKKPIKSEEYLLYKHKILHEKEEVDW